MSDDKRNDDKRNKNNKGDDKTLKTLIALAGFAIGATSMVAWNNRKTIQDKALDAKERALELKEKTIELTETVRNKISELHEKKITPAETSTDESVDEQVTDNQSEESLKEESDHTEDKDK